MNVLIIEDENKTAKALKALIEQADENYRVVGVIPSVKAAISWFETNPSPDLIFSDIQLADGLSFDIFSIVKVKSPVIFCTAFDEYAIRAFEANSIDYLLKPIDEKKLNQSLNKYQDFKALFEQKKEQYNDRLTNLSTQIETGPKRALLVYYKEKIIPIKTTDINFIYAEAGIIRIYTADNSYATHYNMEQLEAMLDPLQYLRANRQFIINRDCVQNVEQYFNRRLFVQTFCETPEKVIISKQKAFDFLHWIEL